MLTAYKEPSGPGVRVDSCGYLGYAPPPQFDPMFAKLICQSNSTHSFASALDHTLRALDEFHIGGLPTNLRAAARGPVASGGARRRCSHDLLLGARGPRAPTARRRRASGSLALLEQQATALGGGKRGPRNGDSAAPPGADRCRPAKRRVESPHGRRGHRNPVEAGDTVEAGAALMVISAMKMETAITAPCAGVVTDPARRHRRTVDSGPDHCDHRSVDARAPTPQRHRAAMATTLGADAGRRARRCRRSHIDASRPTRTTRASFASASAAS